MNMSASSPPASRDEIQLKRPSSISYPSATSTSAANSTTTTPTITTITATTGGNENVSAWTNSTSSDDIRHKKEMDEFRAALQPTFHAHPGQELVREVMMQDSACLRFLRARHFAVDKAVQHFKRALQVRVQQHIDAVLLAPFITAAAFNRILCRGFHGYDRFGRPIYVERIGCIDVDMVSSAMTLQQRLAFCRYQAEYIRKIEFPRASARIGKRIDQVVILVDMRGFNRHHIRPSQYTFIHALTSNDSLLYPERLAYTVLINVPTVFSLVWRIVSAWMDAQMKAKFFLFSAEEADKARTELTRRIDPSMLPACMGGTCKCGPISQPPLPHKLHESSGGDGDATAATTKSAISAANSFTTLTPTTMPRSADADSTLISTTTTTSSDHSTSATFTASLQSSGPSIPTTTNNPAAVADVISYYVARATTDSPPATFTTTATASSPPATTPTPTPTPASASLTSTTPPARTQAAPGQVAVALSVAGDGGGSSRRSSAPATALATSLPVATATTKRASLPPSSSPSFFAASKSATSSSSSSPQKRSGSGGGSGTISISGPVSGHASAYKWDPDYCLTNSRENRQFLEFCQHGIGIHTPEQLALAAAAAAVAQAQPTASGEQISHEDETRIAASVQHAEQMEQQSHTKN